MSSNGTLIGVLVDVSGSMQSIYETGNNLTNDGISRIESVLQTIHEILKQELKNDHDNRIFASAFGLSSEKADNCDLLQLMDGLEKSREQFEAFLKPLSATEILNGKWALNRLLEQHDVLYAEKFLNDYLTDEQCARIHQLAQLPENGTLVKEFIEKLPVACKNPVVNVGARGGGFLMNIFGVNYVLGDPAAKATREHAKEALAAFESFFTKKLESLINPGENKIFPVRDALSIYEKALGKETNETGITKANLDQFVSLIKPLIYGGTPLCAALRKFHEVFEKSTQKEKILFLVTDGQATDGKPGELAKEFRSSGIRVIVCFLTNKNFGEEKRFYYKMPNHWDAETKSLFELASDVDNFHPLMSLPLERGWQLAPEGRSKLFIQANHPSTLSEVGQIASAGSVSPVLSLISRTSLDEFINSEISMVKGKAPKQVGGTCYANASAWAIYFAQKRIYQRKGGYSTFEGLREEMIQRFGKDGAVIKVVLDEFCKKHRLQCNKIDESAAKVAISQRRSVVTTFRLSEKQWSKFSEFYTQNPSGILTKESLGSEGGEQGGHAVILIKVEPDCLVFMNSWGPYWADNGYFRIKDASTLDCQFYDVLWTLRDLTPEEKADYNKWKASGATLIEKLPESIKSLAYTCPKCHRASPANKFRGNFEVAVCPLCHQDFTPMFLDFIPLSKH